MKPVFLAKHLKTAMKSPENHHLHQAEQLLSTLMEEIPRIQTFKGKWAIIKNKLNNFPTQLHQLSEFPTFSTSPLASELVQSISQTLANALSLTTKCTKPNLIDGKLRTQSDIDSVSAVLDQHIKDIELIIKTGVLQDSAVVNTPKSTRESVRVEARNLITRLQIGNSESKNAAIDSLLGLLYEDDKNVLIVVAQGLLPILVRLLDSSCLEVKEKAVSAISRVLVVDSCKHVLVAEGVLLINHLLRILESRSGFAKEKACVALQALSFSRENARAIGCRSGISSVLEICQSGTLVSQAYAAGVLRNLAGFVEIRQNFVDENAIPVLIRLSNSGTFVAQENAIGCLSNLVSEDESLKLLVFREGGIECLKNFWDAAPTVQSLEVAVGLLRNLVSCKSIREALVNGAFIDEIMGALNCGVVSVRIAAAGAIYELGFSSKMRRELAEVGIIPQLVRMLDAKAVEEKEMVAKALSSLLLNSRNRRLFTKEEKAIDCVVQLLDPLLQNLDKTYLISVLASIASSKKCRKQMVAAGACAYLQKLAERDIAGARKLHDRLDGNNIWGVFARTK
ncbi:hypothetical protein L1049_006100 [Liquidambar formosana]|uniref:DUF7032 domain-containing protein n=1 Tax=Liquidambar formosana TaxID=63359 RepID=A0AAP0WTQ8_LIQFO